MNRSKICIYLGEALFVVFIILCVSDMFFYHIPDAIQIAVAWIAAILTLIGAHYRKVEKKEKQKN